MNVFAEKSFFKNISNLLPDQSARLSYGVAVTDFDNDPLTISSSNFTSEFPTCPRNGFDPVLVVEHLQNEERMKSQD